MRRQPRPRSRRGDLGRATTTEWRPEVGRHAWWLGAGALVAGVVLALVVHPVSCACSDPTGLRELLGVAVLVVGGLVATGAGASLVVDTARSPSRHVFAAGSLARSAALHAFLGGALLASLPWLARLGDTPDAGPVSVRTLALVGSAATGLACLAVAVLAAALARRAALAERGPFTLTG